jgi:hypothetical protein
MSKKVVLIEDFLKALFMYFFILFFWDIKHCKMILDDNFTKQKYIYIYI